MSDRPDCRKPDACTAKGNGLCRSCRAIVTMNARWQDPERRAKQADVVKARWQDPEFRANHAAAVKTYQAGRYNVEVPKWVPAGLVDEYFRVAARYGEERAASHCRRIKLAAARNAAVTDHLR